MTDTRYDTSPLGTGKNWVTKAGGLPDFIRAIAHALERNGHDEAGAIQLAIGAVKNWASGGGKVTEKTRAKAADAVAQWEAMKASTGRSDGHLGYRASGSFAAGHAFEGNQWGPGNQPVPPAQAAQQLNTDNAGAFILASAYQKGTGQTVTGQFTVAQLAGYQSILGSAGAKTAAAGAAKAAAAVKAQAAKALAAQKAAAAAAKKAQTQATTASNKATAAQKAAASQAKTAANQATSASAKAGNVTMSTKTAATSASIAKAAKVNALPADQRLALSTGVPPAGHAWVSGKNGMTLQQVTAPTPPATKAAAAPATPATPSVSAPTSATPTAAAPAASSTTAKASTAIPAATAQQVAFATAANMPATKQSQANANAINKLPAAGRAQYAMRKPPAGFTWTTDAQGGKTLTLTKREDSDDLELRDMVGESTNGVGALLPIGPTKKVESEVLATLEKHRFVGTDLGACEQCGKSVTNGIHRRATTDVRHAGSGHEKVSTGHIKGSFHRHLQAAKSQGVADQAKIEPGLQAAMTDHFSRQRKAVISRLTGKRGKTMLKRASTPPPPPGGGIPPPVPFAATPAAAGATAAAVDPAAVFDAAFWAGALEQTLTQHYALAAEVAGGRVRSQVGAPASLDDQSSLKHVADILAIRAQRQAAGITETTRQAIYAALQKGVVEGEGVTELTGHINAIFDTADAVRAALIARTETVGSLNQAAHAYAANLPEGTVGSHTWISHHDDRTRPHHREADGQTVPTSRPFYVGGWPMLFPGDPAAPPDEVCNCRCSQAFLPPGMSMGQGILSAKSLQGLLPQSSLDALAKIQADQATTRKTLVGATAAIAH